MPERKTKKIIYVFLFLRIAVVTCGVIWGYFWIQKHIGWQSFRDTFAKINILVFAFALLIFMFCQVLVTLRWWVLLRSQSVYIDFWPANKLNFLGLFYNNFMPSSVGGDLVRAWYVTHHTEKRFAAALSVFVDRIIGLIGTFLIAVFFYVVFLRGQGAVLSTGGANDKETAGILERYKEIVIIILLLPVLVVCILAVFKKGRSVLGKVWGILSAHGIAVIKKTVDAAVIYCKKPMAVLTALGLTIFLQLFTIWGFWLVGTELGLNASIYYYCTFFTLSWVIGAIPVSIGGAVVVEGTLAYMFIHFAGASKEAAAGMALCQRIIWMISSLPGAVIHLSGKHLPKDLSEISE